MNTVSRYIPHASLTAMFALWMAFFIIAGANVFTDPDSAWHLATGDLIRTLGTIPAVDPWSFTAGDTPWFNLSWGYNIAISWIKERFGMGALYGISLTTYALCGALQAWFAYRHGKANIAMVVLSAYLCLWMVHQGLLLRPHMITMLLSVLFYQALSQHRNTKHITYLYTLPLLMLPWVNLHGGYLTGLILIGIFGLEALLQQDKNRFVRLVFAGLACVATTLANPYGIYIYEGALRTLGSPMQAYIIEWLPLNAGAIDHQMTLLFVLFILVFSQFRNAAIPLADRILAVVIVLGMVTSIRHGILGAPLLIPYIAYCHTQRTIGDDSVFHKTNVKLDGYFSDPVYRFGMLCVCAALIVFSLTSFPRDTFLRHTPDFKQSQRLDRELEYIKTHYPDTRFLNFYDLGGMMIYQTRGAVPVFFDGRERTAYPLSLVNDYITFMKWNSWNRASMEILERYRIGGLIFDRHADVLEDFSHNPFWVKRFEGPKAVIFTRAKELKP